MSKFTLVLLMTFIGFAFGAMMGVGHVLQGMPSIPIYTQWWFVSAGVVLWWIALSTLVGLIVGLLATTLEGVK